MKIMGGKRQKFFLQKLRDKKWDKIVMKAGMYRERSGNDFFSLVFKEGKDVKGVCEEMKKHGITMFEDEVEYYKVVLTNPAVIGKKLTQDIIEYLSTRLGMHGLNANLVLQEIIFLGRTNLWKNQKVSVNEMLKALQIQKELQEEGMTRRITEQIDMLLESGTEGTDGGTGEGDQGSEKEGVLPEDQVRTDSDCGESSQLRCTDIGTGSGSEGKQDNDLC